MPRLMAATGHPGARRSVRRVLSLALALASTAVLLPASTADATFPGVNGRIAYGVAGAADCRRMPNCETAYIETVRPHGGTPQRAKTCQPEECSHTGPAWAPNGRRLAVAFDVRQIFGSDIDGTPADLITDDGKDPAWSPDGERLVFARNLDKQRNRFDRDKLHIVSFPSGAVRRLTRLNGARPDWSSRGLIAFVRRNRDFSTDVWTTRPDGRPATRLSRGGLTDNPSWAPGGRLLAVDRARRQRGPRNVVILNRRGRVVRTVTRRGGKNPVWSPDGKKIAFVRDGDLYVASARGGGLRRVVRDRWDIFGGASWQPVVRR